MAESEFFDKLGDRIEALLEKHRALKEENRALASALAEKEALLDRLVTENESAEASKAESRQRLQELLRRIDEEVDR